MCRDVVLRRDGGEWRGELRYLGNVITQIVDKSKKTLQLLAGQWRWPVLQVGQSRGIDRLAVRVDTEAQEFDLQACEMAFADIEDQLGLIQSLNDHLQMLRVIVPGFGEYDHIVDENAC